MIRRNYDAVDENHTVGSAVRCGSGRIYVGVNVYSLHGACAEFIAIGAAITAGEREFLTIASARGPEGSELPPPCGNCRQMLSDYSPGCDVILDTASGPAKVKVTELLPYSYRVE